MKIDWDVPIRMDDGLVLRADVFRPDDDGSYPAILSYGPYGKGLAFQDGYKTAWDIMARENPDARRRLVEPLPELGSGRSREVGARRLRRASASTRAAPGARPATSATTTRARRATSTNASSGPPRSPGAAARWA